MADPSSHISRVPEPTTISEEKFFRRYRRFRRHQAAALTAFSKLSKGVPRLDLSEISRDLQRSASSAFDASISLHRQARRALEEEEILRRAAEIQWRRLSATANEGGEA